MRIKLLIISIAIALCLSASPAMADINSGVSVVDRTSGYYDGDGGEFTISTASLSTVNYSLGLTQTKNIATVNYVSAGPGYPGYPGGIAMTTSFQSFCVEINEFIVPLPHMVEETWVSLGADAGGVSGGSPDPLDPMTAYLYTQFVTGNLAASATPYDYNPAAGRASSALQLQKAIWFIEGEIGVGDTALNTLGASTDALAWYNEALAVNWTGIGNVRVLNLYDYSTLDPLQSMLYMVPVPGAVLLGILGLSVAGIKLRKYT